MKKMLHLQGRQSALPVRNFLKLEKQGEEYMRKNESAENYLETILMLKNKNGAVRSIDIVRHLDYSKPSVSHAMSLLREKGHVTMNKEGWIELTESGREIAEKIYERHCLLTKWLVQLGVPEDIAAEDACKLEHDISEETFDKMKAHIEMQMRPKMD